MIEQKALIIDAAKQEWQVKKINDEKILGPVDFGFHMTQKEDYFCMGAGILAGSLIPGTHRLIITGKSPLWETFYISTMGGAALKFHKLGINYLAIKDAVDEYCILRITNYAGKLSVDFEPVKKLHDIWKGNNDYKGVMALQDYALNHCEDCQARELCDECRVIGTGPASLYTSIGALGSSVISKGSRLTGIECWAGRGGLGSKLLQQHNIVGIVYGGDYHNGHHLRDLKKINDIFVKTLGKQMMPAITEATTKYRYDPKLKSGGTFGANVTRLKSWMLFLNWSSVYLPDEKRLEIYNRLIRDHYLKQFNEETIKPRNFKNCGEPCPAVCKKYRGKYKKDYEPYEALGPNSGIFDQRAAEKANHFIDEQGFDAIQAGNLVSWIMELVYKGIIPKEDLGLTLTPKWDLDNFDVVNDSMHNANVVIEIINMVYSEKGEIFRHGIRQAAKLLDQKYNKDTIHKALFTPHGEKGCIGPNQYWVPSFFISMPIQGKYFEDYETVFKEPYDLGVKSANRMVYELYSDNGGICRFHRKWVEKVIPNIVNELYGENIDYYKHHKRLANSIDVVHDKSVFWESERVIDVVQKYLEKILTGEPNNKVLAEWVKRFQQDKWDTAKDYWEQVSDGIRDGLKI